MKRTGAESLLHRIVENGLRSIYDNEEDEAIIKMSGKADESKAEESVSKCEHFSDNIELLKCNGSNFHYTCHQVSGIHGVGLYCEYVLYLFFNIL